MRTPRLATVAALFLAIGFGLAQASPALAHFGMVVPDTNLVTPDKRTVNVKFLFWHPMENNGMDLAKPKAEVVAAGRAADISGALREEKQGGHSAWAAAYTVPGPGVYVFSMTPQPYFEPAEDKYIVHYAKTVVSAMGAEDGWDKPVGTEVEIIPMSKPFGLWAGSSFTGRAVRKGGKPLAWADVEIEYFNADGKKQLPDPAYATQVVKTDGNGVFTYAMPWAGWWGFAALGEREGTLKHDGAPKKVEIGGIIWVYAHEIPGR